MSEFQVIDPEAGRQTFFVAEDGHGEPTLWAHWDDPEDPEDPHAVLRRRDLGDRAHHWEEIVRRIVVAGTDPYQ